MIWRSFYSNETVKCSWSDSPSSSGDVVHVFMSSFSETADAENTASSTRFSMYVCSKWNRTSVSFINRDSEHARFIFKVFLRLNIYRYYSIASRFKCTDLLLINSSKLRHIPWHSALYGKFHYMTAFRDSARIFCIADIIVDCDLLQLQQRLLLPYLWETTDAWSSSS